MCLIPLSIIFQLHVYRAGQFYCWREPEYPEKTTDLPQVNDKFVSDNVVSSTLSGIRTHNFSGDMPDFTSIFVNPTTITATSPHHLSTTNTQTRYKLIIFWENKLLGTSYINRNKQAHSAQKPNKSWFNDEWTFIRKKNTEIWNVNTNITYINKNYMKQKISTKKTL